MHLDGDSLLAAAREAGLRPASLVVIPLDIAAAPIEFEAEAPLYPASMIKVPLVAAMLVAIADGQLDTMESKVAVTPENMTVNDLESPLVPGYEATLHELMLLAISRSDNVATNVLFDVIGREHATAIARDRLNLPSTEFHRKLSGSEPLIDDPAWDGIHRNSHPAMDAARLFRAIADDNVPQAALLREMLAAQQWNGKLNLGLRPDDRFLHKTGDTDEVTHDGGILHTAEEKRYVVVAYTGLSSTDEHNARFGPFMASVRDFL
jgi:beta-lactamase class A